MNRKFYLAGVALAAGVGLGIPRLSIADQTPVLRPAREKAPPSKEQQTRQQRRRAERQARKAQRRNKK